MKKVLVHLLVLWLCLPLTILADPISPYTLKQLDSRSGLSNSSINYLFQDSDNLLWVATWDGLNVYDGTGFHVFNYSKENIGKSIGNNVIFGITEDKRGNIWISTIEGISKYEKKTGRFSNYFYENEQKNSVSEKEFSIHIDKDGEVYCLTKKYGLTVYDPAKDTFYIRNVSTNEKLAKFRFDENNHLWALTKQGHLAMYEKYGDGFKKSASFEAIDSISNFFYVNNRVLALTNSKHLYGIDADLKRTWLASFDYDVNDIAFYKDHYVVAWSFKGYGMYENDFKPSTFLSKEMEPMKLMKVTSISSREDQILWCGTDGSGMVKIFQKEQNFGLVTKYDKTNFSNIKQVRAFCELDGNLWIATKGNGIVVLQNFSNITGDFSGHQLFQSPAELDNNLVYSILKGKDSLLYIGSDGKGVVVYDTHHKKFIKWNDILGTEQQVAFGNVYSIIQDEDNSIWLGTSGFGLIHLKITRTNNGRFALSYLKQYAFDGKDSGPGNDIIFYLEKGNDDRIWMGCRYGGLSVFNKKTQTFRTFKAFSYEGSLSHNDVLSLYKDKHNRLWIGTSYGLNWIDEKDAYKNKVIFKKLTVDDGLPNNTIHAIQEANGDYIWISTNKGLARINPTNLQIERFQEADGLQSNEFCDGAVFKNRDGYLLFGGIFGFNFFLPEKISGSIHQTNVLVSDLQFGGKLYNENSLTLIKPGQNENIGYTLEPNNNYFDFNIKSIDFLNGDKTEYAYFLEGYDKAWHFAGSTVKISYFNIPPGKYKLKIKWSNGEGKWTPETDMLKVEVKPFFWRSWTAIVFYFLLMGIGGYALYRYRKNKVEMKHSFAMEHMMRIKEDEIHQEQLSFFTNITHELQTPLTLINGSIERFFYKNNTAVKNIKEQYFLSIVHQQSSRLTYLVNQLLDFRKAEAGYLKNQFSHLDISGLLSNIANLFVPLCDQKDLDYNIEISPTIIGWMDKDKLEKIIFNLLSNAFKHSDRNQIITFEVSENPIKGVLEIVVKNSGCQLSTMQLSLIFDKFFVVDANQSDKYSNGIGLAFTRQLVTLLNGHIQVANEENWITFRTEIPLPKHSVDGKDDTETPLTHTPSYLLRSITANLEEEQLTPKENNKRALINELEENGKKSILIVEDEPAIRFLLKDLLEESYVVYEAESGMQAIELLQTVTPNLIISDVMMQDIDGLELCNKVKNSPDTCHIPFILLSARGSMEQKTEGYDAGADAYIPKPFDTMHLLVRVRKLLEYRQRLHNLFKKEGPTPSLEEKNLADGDKEFLNKLVQVIEENIEDTELNAAFLEPLMVMSKMQLYRKLKSLSNMTPNEFIKHIRLQRTVQLLQTTQLSVSEIYYQSGFNNQSYFFREFKKRFNCSPSEYRAQQKIHV